jgi:hypothetical protein
LAKEDQFIRTWGPPETKQNKTNKATRYLTGKRKILAIKRSRRSCPPANPLEKNKKKMTAGEINEKEQKQINEMINLK